MNTKLNIVFIAALLLSSCINEECEQDFIYSPTGSFYATIEKPEGPESKAYADDRLRVL
ncbi:MAG: hypothetical protein IKH11_06010 [Bacteroidales bacterium]|nr:hypothetical protein [Bacteroidales bacterium]